MANRPNQPAPAKGFAYDGSPQRSRKWIDLHVGRVGASQLGNWLAVSKRDGSPLTARLDLEREIAFAKTFQTPFTHFVTKAMQDGIDNEDFIRQQYSDKFKVVVDEVGCFYNDHFVASPDGLVAGNGGIEIKWLQDTNWTKVLQTRQALDDHYKQIQGNLLATGRQWWDYIAANPNTGRFIVIRVKPDKRLMTQISESVKMVEKVKPFSAKGVFQFNQQPSIAKEVEW